VWLRCTVASAPTVPHRFLAGWCCDCGLSAGASLVARWWSGGAPAVELSQWRGAPRARRKASAASSAAASSRWRLRARGRAGVQAGGRHSIPCPSRQPPQPLFPLASSSTPPSSSPSRPLALDLAPGRAPRWCWPVAPPVLGAPRSSSGLRVDFKEVQGPFRKMTGARPI
jgi:hypothetical protein